MTCVIATLLALLTLSWRSLGIGTDETQPIAPVVEALVQPCARPATRPRICARIFDDQTIVRARVLFRAAQAKHFYWTEMSFDGSRHCAILPLPSAETIDVEYYIEAIDNEYEITRTRTETLRLDTECSLENDEDPADPSVVGTTAPGQHRLPPGFDAQTIEPASP